MTVSLRPVTTGEHRRRVRIAEAYVEPRAGCYGFEETGEEFAGEAVIRLPL